MTKLIRKNASKKLQHIFSTAKNCKTYTLDNCFIGETITGNLESILKREHTLFSGELRLDELGNCKLRIHSNCWFTFECDKF